MVTTGKSSVLFFSWEEGTEDFTYYEPLILKNTFPQANRAKAELT
jgi:hypothetical protein